MKLGRFSDENRSFFHDCTFCKSNNFAEDSCLKYRSDDGGCSNFSKIEEPFEVENIEGPRIDVYSIKGYPYFRMYADDFVYLTPIEQLAFEMENGKDV